MSLLIEIDGSVARTFLHLEASHLGPVISNEAFIATEEFDANPEIERLVGIVQPYSSIAGVFGMWIRGLPTPTIGRLLGDLEGFVPMDDDGTIPVEFLARRADEITIDQSVLQAALFSSVSDAGHELGVSSTLRASIPQHRTTQGNGAVAVLEDVFVRTSSTILNGALAAARVPLVDTRQVAPSQRRAMASCSIDADRLKHHLDAGKHRLTERRLRAIRELEAVARTRGISPEDAHELSSRRVGRRSSASVYPKDWIPILMGRSQHPHFRVLRLQEDIDLAMRALRLSVVKSRAHPRPYVSGADMLRECFRFSQEAQLPLLLQTLRRGGEGATYGRLRNEFPHAPVFESASNIYDGENAAVVDHNVIYGVHHVLGKRFGNVAVKGEGHLGLENGILSISESGRSI